jgi:hypothetical protein
MHCRVKEAYGCRVREYDRVWARIDDELVPAWAEWLGDKCWGSTRYLELANWNDAVVHLDEMDTQG